MEKLKREAPISIYPPIVLYNKQDVKRIWEVPEALSEEEIYSNLYVHIPFCAQKCEFCYFNSFPAGKSLVDAYVEALVQEIKLYAKTEIVQKKIFHTVYFGGGTPTYLRKEQFQKIITTLKQELPLAKGFEFCVEVRPGREATEEVLQMLYDEGVNRISMGAQSFVQEILDYNGRKQTIAEFMEVYQRLRRIGFQNINVDIMSGMIGDTTETWKKTIDTVLSLQPENITVYKMCIYKSSKLYEKYHGKQETNVFISDEVELERIKYFYERLHEAGYMESSNPYTFTNSKEYDHTYRKSRTSGLDLLGVGLSSNSYFNHVAFQNTHDIQEYITKLGNGEYAIKNGYRLNKEEIIQRALVFGVKTTKVDRKKFEQLYGVDPYEWAKDSFDRMVSDQRAEVTKEEIHLIGDSYLFADDIVRNYLFSDRERNMEALLVMHKNVKLSLKER